MTEPLPTHKDGHIFKRLYNWVLHRAHTPYGTPALATLSFAEASFFPIPPDPLLLALAFSRPKRSLFYSLICSVMSVLGGVLGFVIGYYLWQEVGLPIVKFYGGVDLANQVAEKFAGQAFFWVFLAGLTPIPYKVFTIGAGMAAMQSGQPIFLVFLAASVTSRSLRFFAEGTLVYFYGEHIRKFIEKYFDLMLWILAGLGIAGFFVVYFI